jgi:uncharacterized protein
VNPKRELVRVVRTPDGAIVIDVTGRANGRGAYVHKAATCIESAVKKRAIDHALKATILDDQRATLATGLLALPGVEPASIAGQQPTGG